jgi:peptidoglycan/xylan/chitin deacetylase (PgdA/CDA1 family)
MNWDLWGEIEALLIKLGIQPLLGVIPDNQDQSLVVQKPIDDFWARVRTWQARGWTIGLHGYQHRYVSANAGLVATRKKSEFAGLPIQEQAEKLKQGTAILAREKISPEVWIAPGNTFDAATVSLLPRFGIRVISDGSFFSPFRCNQGLMWVPQQLFSFRPTRGGVWTVCYHHNEWSIQDLRKFQESLYEYREDICSLPDVLQAYDGRRSRLSMRLCTNPRLSRLLVRARLKFWSLCGPC